MSTADCSLAALLNAGGPVRVAIRPCCLVALVGRRASPAGRTEPGAASGTGGGNEPGASGPAVFCQAAVLVGDGVVESGVVP